MNTDPAFDEMVLNGAPSIMHCLLQEKSPPVERQILLIRFVLTAGCDVDTFVRRFDVAARLRGDGYVGLVYKLLQEGVLYWMTRLSNGVSEEEICVGLRTTYHQCQTAGCKKVSDPTQHDLETSQTLVKMVERGTIEARDGRLFLQPGSSRISH